MPQPIWKREFRREVRRTIIEILRRGSVYDTDDPEKISEACLEQEKIAKSLERALDRQIVRYGESTIMNLSRRKFTALLGLAPAAAPLAAKAAADAGIGQLVGIRDLAPPVAYGAGGMSAPPSQLDDYARSQIAAADYVRMFGVPDFVKENTRRNCGYISALDPDIACKRSWSMSVKIATQRQRNYERSIEQMQHSAWHTKARAGFKTLAGFDWPW